MALAATILQAQLKTSHDWLMGTLGNELTKDQAHFKPDGHKIMPISALLTHIITTEDFFVNLIAGKKPLMATDFAGKVGASELPPQGSWDDWAQTVTIDIEQIIQYAQAVFKATEEYVGGLSDDDIAEEIDLSPTKFGTQTRYYVLSIVLLNNYSHTGEISFLKGLQGLKGYPM